MSGAHRVGGDLDELPRQLTELRALIREAHGATKDLNRAIKEAREYADGLVRMVDAAVDAATRGAHRAGVEQMTAFQAHIQAELNQSAAQLNTALVKARDHIGKALTPKIAAVEVTADEITKLAVTFEGGLFDADPVVRR